jgi:hypothetical protein
LTEAEQRAFLLARGLLERAEASIDGTPPGAMAAVVLYDVAVETAAKAIASPRRQTKTKRIDRDPSLPEVLTEIRDLWAAGDASHTGDVSELQAAARLHELRNGVQHDGRVPSDDDLVRSRIRALEAVEWLAAEFLERELASISRASLVVNADVRAQLEQAERFGDDGIYDLGAERLAVALEIARREFQSGDRRYRRRLQRRDVQSAVREVRQGGGDPHGLGYRAFNELLETLSSEVESLQDHVSALSAGARASDYTWFQRRFPGVSRMSDGSWYAHPRAADLTREEYVRGLDFVTSIALHWQQFPAPPTVVDEPTFT